VKEKKTLEEMERELEEEERESIDELMENVGIGDEAVPITPVIDNIDDFVKKVPGYKEEPVPRAEQVEKLRKYRTMYEKERMNITFKALGSLYRELHACVNALFVFSDVDDGRVGAMSKTFFYRIIKDFANAGVLPLKVSLTSVMDLRDKIETYVEANMTDAGLPKTAILVGIGRNHSCYYDAADYAFAQLCSEGVLEKRSRRYYKV